MRLADLAGKNIVIWGKGREGLAAESFIRQRFPDQPITFVDEATDKSEHIAAALNKADVIIKSPGVSLHHPLVEQALAKKIPVTSLLNLWIAEPHTAKIIAITGTKGKSTTSALLAHTLNNLGKKAVLVGNIGIPVTEAPDNVDFIILEVSSYQAANFSGNCSIAILTSLYPEHLDWHHSLENYYREKLNLLKHSSLKIVNAQTLDILHQQNLNLDHTIVFNQPKGMHTVENNFLDGTQCLNLHRSPLPPWGEGWGGGSPQGVSFQNTYLLRPVNLSNVCAVLAAAKKLGLDPKQALVAMQTFKGLPHRQQELGEKNDILYVDDSISTTPQSAIAAMEAYKDKPITLIAGGHDRGIDYKPLTDYILKNNINAVICMGPSGERIFDTLWKANFQHTYSAPSMHEAIIQAKTQTPWGGVILLSPAAPSYGLFKNFEERGQSFAKESGF